jgi:hypothetical protein
VMNHVFSPAAMLVASLDLLSGILVFAYMKVAGGNLAELPAAQRSLS